ncbi:membrane protein [Bacteroidia bacterium]|nr:membrane protein [Bacteroidia bacterium]GHT80718.1 membrane protein [Bacteroidia bacterium]
MKNLFFTSLLLLFACNVTVAQKYALIDSEYILKKMAKYKAAQEQVDKASAQYQKEVDDAFAAVDDMYRVYQAEKVLLSDELKRKRESNIIAAEKDAKELQRKYFGADGALFKKREELINPIMDLLYKAVKDVAEEGGYATIFDVSNNPSIVYSNRRFDKSDDVLKKLGF